MFSCTMLWYAWKWSPHFILPFLMAIYKQFFNVLICLLKHSCVQQNLEQYKILGKNSPYRVYMYYQIWFLSLMCYWWDWFQHVAGVEAMCLETCRRMQQVSAGLCVLDHAWCIPEADQALPHSHLWPLCRPVVCRSAQHDHEGGGQESDALCVSKWDCVVLFLN